MTGLAAHKPALAAPARWQDYFQLLKPRVMSLVVFTGLTGLVAADTPMHPVLAAVTILCIAVGAGASAALNMWYDADIDARMRRTRSRPVPSGKVQVIQSLEGGILDGLYVKEGDVVSLRQRLATLDRGGFPHVTPL